MLGADRGIDPAHVGMDLALQSFRLYRRLRIHLFRIGCRACRSRQRRRRSSRSRASRWSSTRSRCRTTLGVGQVLVKVLYTTICGAQINEIAAAKGPDKFLPHLLGHEASARVLEIGPGVTTVKPGDTVVLHWRPSRASSASRRPTLARRKAQRRLGDDVQRLRGHVGEPHDGDPARLRSARRAAARLRRDHRGRRDQQRRQRQDRRVGRGLRRRRRRAERRAVRRSLPAPIRSSRSISSTRSSRWRRSRGATHCLNANAVSATSDAEIRKIVGAKGPDKVIETTGVKSVIELAYDLTHADGTCVLVGVPSEKVSIYTLPIHFNKVLTGSHGGDAVPHVDIPRLIRLDRAGRLSFDGLITHEFPLDEINDALDLVRSGAAGRVVLNIGAA